MAVVVNQNIPAFLRAAMTGSRPLVSTFQTLADTNVLSTSSFQYDPANQGLKSTQQLNIDWSQFPNHCFFMSAEAKVNLAFDQIINGFPFDGTRQETEVFLERLTGFDKWVFDNFPIFHGELLFSGTQTSETSPSAGTYISVQNKAGALFPDLAANNSGAPVLNPTGSQSMTIEMQLYLPPITNDVQVVCQMLSSSNGPGNTYSTQGFSVYLSQSLSTSSVQATFAVVSGSSYMQANATLTKGQFNHVAFVLNRDNGLPFLETFLLSAPVEASRTQAEIGDMDINGANFIIGSGSAFQLGSNVPVVPKQTLSGTIDEFRVFHSTRSPQQQAAFASKTVFATSDLVLYFRFNEPPPPFTQSSNDPINAIVLDYSGNSLHTLVSNFTSSLRLDASNDPLNPVVNERPDAAKVLFPAYPPTVAFNQQLLLTASLYDDENPNLITKLVPQHYLLEGALQDGFQEPEGNANQPIAGSGIPGQAQMGNVQIMVSLLYIIARFYDEIKLFVDGFSTLKTVDYDTGGVVAPDTVPDNFLNSLIAGTGFFLPPLFSDADIDQYIRGENVDIDQYSTNVNTLRYVQHTLQRRVLKSLPSILRSKGTQHAIKSFLRAVGIDPNNVMRLREVGGPTTQALKFARDNRIEPGAMVQFTGSALAISPVLSASRVEPGFPLPVGTFVVGDNGHNTRTTNPNDNLLTSGSWTWEGIVKFTPAEVMTLQNTTQSLARICVSGSLAEGTGLVANLLAVSSSVQPKLVLYIRPNDLGTSSTGQSPLLRLEIDTVTPNIFTGDRPLGIFNFDRWNVSFGCQRGDDGLNSPVSSSYFLRLAYQNNGDIVSFQTTSSFFQESPLGGNNVFQALTTASSPFGPFLSIGPGQVIAGGNGSGYPFLNNILAAPQEARVTDFSGRISDVRFWSRALTENEWKEHVRNHSSTGVETPETNWNYVNTQTGSWGRLRLSSMIRQDTRSADKDGNITFIDFSENGFHLTGSGFPSLQETVLGEVFDLGFFNPYFDEAATNQKVRARSFQDLTLVEETSGAGLAPVYEVDPSEKPTDDIRFSMEFSLVDALDRDIVNIFATLDALDNALGDPTLVFSPDYPDLEALRTVYFNRIKDKLNFAAFNDFFRWFDTSLGTFIQQLIPRKTNFKGINFTVESHILERHKLEYQSSQIYLGDSIRTNLGANILLQQVAGTLRKF